MFRSVILTALLLFIGACKQNALDPMKQVTFRMIPKSSLDSNNILIVRNWDETESCGTDTLGLTRETDSTFIQTISVKVGTKLAYKFLSGADLDEVIHITALNFPNAVMIVQDDTTINLDESNWKYYFSDKNIVSAARLKSGRIDILNHWKYHPGDDLQWAAVNFDDSDWEFVDPLLEVGHLPESGWHGIGWFRTQIYVDSILQQVPLALSLRQTGASEIYLDGKLIYKFGRVGTSGADEETYREHNPRAFAFSGKEVHQLAVRYSNFSGLDRHHFFRNAGFVLSFGELNAQIDKRAALIRENSIYQMFFSVVPLTLALLHLLMFAFYPRARENFFYALCMISFAMLTFSNFQWPFSQNAAEILFWNKITYLSVNLSVLFALLTVYITIDKRLPRHSYIFIAIVVLFLIWGFFSTKQIHLLIFYIFLGITAAEILRTVLLPRFLKRKGNELICIGFIILLITILYQILIALHVLQPIWGNSIVYIYGVLILSILFSIDLARNFARTNRDLEIQLEQVKALSAINQTKDLKAKEEEIALRILEADNARKTQELEEARKLQLSMLPKKIPKFPHLDIAVYIKTATEVGGDYYDFDIAEDGTLTVAIGDATGHGIKAGIMVTLMKNLFNAFGQSFYIPDFFNHCTKIIKSMNLGNLYMGMLIMRIKQNKITVSSAGMPPIYVYRKQKKSVEEIILKGMPLGGFKNFSYKQIRAELAPGDTILLLSDGFIELFNNDKEILDFEQTKALFGDAAEKTPKQIIKHLIAAGKAWQQGHPQDDDVTFVVIKYKESSAVKSEEP